MMRTSPHHTTHMYITSNTYRLELHLQILTSPCRSINARPLPANKHRTVLTVPENLDTHQRVSSSEREGREGFARSRILIDVDAHHRINPLPLSHHLGQHTVILKTRGLALLASSSYFISVIEEEEDVFQVAHRCAVRDSIIELSCMVHAHVEVNR